jgi:hypothetical protein
LESDIFLKLKLKFEKKKKKERNRKKIKRIEKRKKKALSYSVFPEHFNLVFSEFTFRLISYSKTLNVYSYVKIWLE